MKNILTFDIEDWYHPNLADQELLATLPAEDRVEAPTLKIIDLLGQTNNKATFFVVGDIVEKFPHLVKKIVEQGHEVASHGYRHNLVYNYTKNQFETDLRSSLAALRAVTDEPILGYRAPSWSLGERTPWAWEALQKLGFVYDSSLYPFKTFLYGDNNASRFNYEIEINNSVSLMEHPPSVAQLFGKRIPFSGGFFFRVIPYPFIKLGIRQYNRAGHPAIVYLHPWEIDVEQPRLDVDAKRRFILYANIKKTEKKLFKLLQDLEFVSIRDYYNLKPETAPLKMNVTAVE